MAIELTQQQEELLTASSESPPRVLGPRSRTAYVLLPIEDYETIRELLEEERQQRGIREIGLQDAIERMDAEP